MFGYVVLFRLFSCLIFVVYLYFLFSVIDFACCLLFAVLCGLRVVWFGVWILVVWLFVIGCVVV